MGSTLATSLITWQSFCPWWPCFLTQPWLRPASLCIYYCVVFIFTPGQVTSAVVLAQGQGLRLGEEQTVRLSSTLWDLSPETARQSSRHPTRRPALGLCHYHSPGEAWPGILKALLSPGRDLRPEMVQEGTAGP